MPKGHRSIYAYIHPTRPHSSHTCTRVKRRHLLRNFGLFCPPRHHMASISIYSFSVEVCPPSLLCGLPWIVVPLCPPLVADHLLPRRFRRGALARESGVFYSPILYILHILPILYILHIFPNLPILPILPILIWASTFVKVPTNIPPPPRKQTTGRRASGKSTTLLPYSSSGELTASTSSGCSIAPTGALYIINVTKHWHIAIDSIQGKTTLVGQRSTTRKLNTTICNYSHVGGYPRP